jgi:hypothetical protein
MDANMVKAAVAAASTLVPEIAPEVYLIMGIIAAHKRANAGQFPTPEQVDTTYRAVTQSIDGVWASWHPSGDGSLP